MKFHIHEQLCSVHGITYTGHASLQSHSNWPKMGRRQQRTHTLMNAAFVTVLWIIVKCHKSSKRSMLSVCSYLCTALKTVSIRQCLKLTD